MIPTAQDLYRVIEKTWPAHKAQRVGPWIIRDGAGGGSRVSATTLIGDFQDSDVHLAENAMARLGQSSMFMIREDDSELDKALDQRGYIVKDPVTLFVSDVTSLVKIEVPPTTVFPVEQILSIQAEIWGKGAIGPARLEVMNRAATPKTTLLGRINDRPAATAFVALDENISMLHALEVLVEQRRQGLAVYMMRQAANWAQRQGADWLSVVTTDKNAASIKLYTSLGMQAVGHYHYRIKP